MYCICNTLLFLDAEDVDRIALMRVFAILQHNDPRDSIIYVAATGDVPTLRKCLEKHPGEVGLWLVCTVHIHMYMQIEYYMYLEFQATIIHFNLYTVELHLVVS